MVSAVAYTTGIPYLARTGNGYAGGQFYSSGPSGGSGSGPTIAVSSSVDRVFHLDLDAADAIPPTLAGSAIVDNKSGGPVTPNTLVTYTVTFSEDMDATTVSAADFSNAGSAAITFGTVSETTPGVFSVSVVPTTSGTLQLIVNAGAVLKDVAGNALVTVSAIADDTTITVQTTYESWSGGAAFNADANNDGVANGLAWILGAANANSAVNLPTLNNTDPTYLIFTFTRRDEANNAPGITIIAQYGNSLGGWTNAVDDNANVKIETTDGSPSDTVTVKLKRSTLAPGGRLFARLKAVKTP